MDNIRKQFPLIHNGDKTGLVYLDSAATSQKPQRVIDEITRYYTEYNSNVHRGVYPIAEKATNEYINAHTKVAQFIGASSYREIIFTRNTTEGLNLLAHRIAQENLKEGDVIVITEMEHHSNIVPWQMVAKRYKLKLEWIPLKEDYTLDLSYMDFLVRKYRERLKVVSFVHLSNVLGVVNDVENLVSMAKSVGAITIIDLAQSIVHEKIDVKKLDVDFALFSGHKIFGPTGIGVLWGKKELLEKLEPWMGGGEMISKVWKTGAEWNELPWKFEAGTPNISGAIALGTAIDWFEKNIDYEELSIHEGLLMRQLVEGVNANKSVTVVGTTAPEERTAVLAMTLKDAHPHDIASLLGEDGVCVRAGFHCAEPLHKNLGIGPTLRVSFSVYNSSTDVERFITSLQKSLKTLI